MKINGIAVAWVGGCQNGRGGDKKAARREVASKTRVASREARQDAPLAEWLVPRESYASIPRDLSIPP